MIDLILIRNRRQGFTLIEVMITIGVLAILIALAVPSFFGLIERKKLEGATEKMFADFQFARAESIKRNDEVFIVFDPGDTCYGLALVNNCDCTDNAPACELDAGVSKIVNISDFGDTTMTQNFNTPDDKTSFDPRRGEANNEGTVTFNSPRGWQTQVIISQLRVRICSLSGASKVFTYKNC